MTTITKKYENALGSTIATVTKDDRGRYWRTIGVDKKLISAKAARNMRWPYWRLLSTEKTQ